MTPRKQSTFFLLAFLNWIVFSEAGCSNYFTDVEDEVYVNKSLLEPVGYVNLTDKNDSIRCTLEINSPNHHDFKYFLTDCYKQRDKNFNNTMCHGHTIHNISYHHFMCLAANVLKLQYVGCYSGDICLGPSSATATTATPPTTTPPTTVPERPSTAPPQSTVNGSSADHVKAAKNYDIDKPTISLLSISVMLNVVLLLLVAYLWMRQRRKEFVVEFNLNKPTSPQAGLEAPVRDSTNMSLLIENNCAGDKLLP